MKHSASRRDFVKNIAAVSAAAISPLFADVEAKGFTKQISSVNGKSLTSGQKPVLNRIPDTRYKLQGIMQEYITAITGNWLLKVPDANPAILQMFADRDNQPHRDLLPWSGEFAGKYLTGATQILRLTHDPALKNYLSKFVTNLAQLQTDDGYLGPASKNQRLTWGWDVWGHYHIMLGLLFWYEDTNDKPALQCTVKIGALLCRKFLKTGQHIVDAGSVEMNHAVIHSLCLLYKITKTPAYLELAHQIADVEFQDNRGWRFYSSRSCRQGILPG
jgi:DUF1680 family protein